MRDFFTHNPLWIEKTGKIYALLERVKISEDQSKDLLQLRRNNRILTIGSTTAIEGNRLTTQQVFDMIEYSMCQYINDTGEPNNNKNGGLNVTQKEIISLIKENPNIRAFEMAQKLLKPVRTIENNLGQLKEKGAIVRIGSKKTGYRKVNDY
jgi:predicted HTH transcriptional regulator